MFSGGCFPILSFLRRVLHGRFIILLMKLRTWAPSASCFLELATEFENYLMLLRYATIALM